MAVTSNPILVLKDAFLLLIKSFPIVMEETKKKLSIVDMTIDSSPI